MTSILSNLKYALRGLRRAPGFAAVVIGTLVIGIGANTTIFSLLAATRLPFQDLDRIVLIQMVPPDGTEPVSVLAVPEYLALQERHDAFSAVGALLQWPYNLGATQNGQPAERLFGFRYTDTLFEVLGLQPQLGRVFTAEENALNAPPGSAIISHQMWRTRFAGDAGIIGRTIRVDDVPTTIVGVMPEGFRFFEDVQPEAANLWTPLPFVNQQLTGVLRFVTVLAKLKPDVSLEQAQANLDSIAAELGRTRPAANAGWRMQMQPLNDAYFSSVRPLLFILQAAVVLVLTLACANVAGLLLIRTASRRHEVATRYALGAERSRIVSQFLTESALLAVLGGTIGLALAYAGLRGFNAAGIRWFARLPELALDGMGVAFTIAVSAATGLAFGLVPALQVSRLQLTTMLRASRAAGRGAGQWTHGVFVVAQVALALVLLVGAGLLIQNFQRLQRADLGAEPRGVLSFETRLPQDQFQRRVGTFRGFTLLETSTVPTETFDRLWRRLQEIPGVVSTAGSNLTPLGGAPLVPFTIDGRDVPRGPNDSPLDGTTRAAQYMVTPNYFQTMRMPLRRGRDIIAADGADAPWVAVINEAAARHYWPNEDPIGKRILFGLTADEQLREIIGIVGDVTFNLQDRTPVPIVYTPRAQQPGHMLATYGQRAGMTWMLRLTAPADAVLPQVRRAVAEIAPQTPVAQVQMLDAGLAEQIQAPRFYMLFVSGFGAVAILLAALGLYGTMSYSVAQRARELALRIALGAGRRDVAGLVLRHAALLAGVGIIIGALAALGLTRFLQSVLWEIGTTDVPTFVGVACMLALVALAAVLPPTYRALRTNPRDTLSES